MAISAEAKVGMFVFTAIIMLGILVLGVADINIRGGGYKIDALFPSAAGLEESADVSMAGMKIGTVQKIKLENDDEGNPRVRVSLRINDGVKIPKGSIALITVSSLLSERYVEITPAPSSGEFIKPGSVIEGKPPADFATLLSETGGMMGDIKETLNKVRGFLSEENKERVENTLKDLEKSTGDLSDVISSRKSAIAGTIDKAHSITTTVDNILSPNEERLKKTISDLSVVVEDLRTVTTDLKSITTKIDTGQGTLGKLVNDPTLYDNLNETIKSANKLITDFQERPTRYLDLSIF